MAIRRRAVILAASAFFFSPFAAVAQQAAAVRRIGFLAARARSTSSNPDALYDAFVQRMRELGYVEGRNLVIEWRFAEGKYERLPSLAAELVEANVEVLVTAATPPTLALQRATRTIPIVAMAIGDPVRDHIVASLGRPGGNITGISIMTGEANVKQLELLKAALPKISRVAVLANPANSNSASNLGAVQAAASKFGLRTLFTEARNPAELDRAFERTAKERADAVLVMLESFFSSRIPQIADLAIKYRLPAIYGDSRFADSGGLMSYGQNLKDVFRGGAVYVDKILKGARPGDLPVEQPTTFDLVVNRKTARLFGLTIAADVLLRANKLIE